MAVSDVLLLSLRNDNHERIIISIQSAFFTVESPQSFARMRPAI